MAVSFIGTVEINDATSVSSRNSSNMPAGMTTGDVLFMVLLGGASTSFHGIAATGVTWVQQDDVTASGHHSSLWRGLCTNGAAAASQPVVVTSLASDGVTPQLTKISASGVILRGTNNSGTAGANAVDRISAPLLATTGNVSMTAPNVAGTSVAGTVHLSVAAMSRGSNVPGATTLTADGNVPDVSAFTSGTVSLGATGMEVDTTPLSAGSTPGGVVWTADQSSTPRNTWTIAVAPALAAPTVSLSLSTAYPEVGQTITLNGSVTGTATAMIHSIVSGPANPTISGSTTATGTVSFPTPGVYVVSFGASNTAGSATPATASVYVHPVSGDPVPVLATTLGAFTLLAGTAGPANLNDSSDSTGIQRTGTPVHTDKATLFYAPYGPGNITFHLRARYTTSALTMRAIVYKEDGTTVVYTEDFPLTASVALYDLILDSTALAAIPALSDRRALQVKVSAA